MKKIACLLLCLSAPALHAHSHLLKGGYLMGGLGATNLQVDVKQQFSGDDLTDLNPFFPGKNTLYGNNAAGLLGLGYLHEFPNHLILGAELTAGYTDIEVANNVALLVSGGAAINVSSRLKTRLTNDFALLFKPGIAINKTKMYGLLGPRWGNFKSHLDTNFSFVGGGGGGTSSGSGSDSESRYQCGVTVGAGIKQDLWRHVDIGLEYAYTTYGKIHAPEVLTTLSSSGVPIPGSFLIDQPGINTFTNTLMATLTYLF